MALARKTKKRTKRFEKKPVTGPKGSKNSKTRKPATSSQSPERALQLEASKLAAVLRDQKTKLVLAESCTGGMAAAALAGIPGISEFLCGSFVVYRDASKSRWLGIDSALIEKHGAVSPETAEAMALQALELTSEATIAASITGHLGPGAPSDQDGLIYISVATSGRRKQGQTEVHELRLPPQSRVNAVQSTNSVKAMGLRRSRQMLASQQILRMVRALLTASGNTV